MMTESELRSYEWMSEQIRRRDAMLNGWYPKMSTCPRCGQLYCGVSMTTIGLRMNCEPQEETK